jgi:hypothetical protein
VVAVAVIRTKLAPVGIVSVLGEAAVKDLEFTKSEYDESVPGGISKLIGKNRVSVHRKYFSPLGGRIFDALYAKYFVGILY